MCGVRTYILRLLAVALALIVLVCRAGTAHADVGETEGVDRRGRSVGGHQFSQMERVAWPFVSSRATSSHSIGSASFTLEPNVPLLPSEIEGDFVNYIGSIDFGLAATRWLGFEANLAGAFLVGTDNRGGLAVGTNGVYGGGGGVVLRLLKLPHFYLSLRGRVDGQRIESLAPARLLVGDDGLSLGSLTASGSVWTYGGDLSAAMGLGEWFGIQLSGSAVARRIDIGPQSEVEGMLAGGLGLSIDFAPIRVPLELVLGGRVSWDFGDEVTDVPVSAVQPADDLRYEPEIGLAYSGTPELDLGVYFTGLWSDRGDRRRGGFRLGYYW